MRLRHTIYSAVMSTEENTLKPPKRRAVEPLKDYRSVLDMEQLKSFISEQNKELQATINKKLEESIEVNKANINAMESMLDKKFNSFAGYVDSKIASVRNECMTAVQSAADDVGKQMADSNNIFEDKIDHLERQTKQCDIVVKNIPYRRDEEMRDYVYGICDAIRYTNIDAIKSAFRLSNTTNKSNPIIIKFYDVSDKRNFMQSYLQRCNLNLMDLGFKTKLRIVISEALTKKNNEIFKKAMKLKFDNIFSTVSTKNGLVYYRLDQKSQPRKITSLSSLNAFHSTKCDRTKWQGINPGNKQSRLW